MERDGHPTADHHRGDGGQSLTAAELLSSFSRLRLLVVGDLMLDHWVWGSVSRISPEAPVPVVDVDRYTYTPGGAANVVSNLKALGAQVSVLGMIGDDESGRRLKELLEQDGVEVDGLVVDSERPTTLKTRIIAHSQQVVRADFERTTPFSSQVMGSLKSWLDGHRGRFDGVLLSDYDKGLFRSRGWDEMFSLLDGSVTVAGPKPSNFEIFKGLELVTLNAPEAASASGLPTRTDLDVETAGRALVESLGKRPVLITRGSQGMTLFRSDQESLHFPALATQVFDVSGAGDTVLTLVGLCRAGGATWEQAIELASHAAAVVVRKLGTATATTEEILKSLERG